MAQRRLYSSHHAGRVMVGRCDGTAFGLPSCVLGGLPKLRLGISRRPDRQPTSFHGCQATGRWCASDRDAIEPGKHANVAFLRVDPLTGPASLRSVGLTVKRGTLYYRRDFVLGEPPEQPSGPPG